MKLMLMQCKELRQFCCADFRSWRRAGCRHSRQWSIPVRHPAPKISWVTDGLKAICTSHICTSGDSFRQVTEQSTSMHALGQCKHQYQ